MMKLPFPLHNSAMNRSARVTASGMAVWRKEDGVRRYEIKTPGETTVVIDGESRVVSAGTWYFYSKI